MCEYVYIYMCVYIIYIYIYVYIYIHIYVCKYMLLSISCSAQCALHAHHTSRTQSSTFASTLCMFLGTTGRPRSVDERPFAAAPSDGVRLPSTPPRAEIQIRIPQPLLGSLPGIACYSFISCSACDLFLLLHYIDR